MPRIEFVQPKPRILDWRVQVDGRSIGSGWKCGEAFRVSIATMEAALLWKMLSRLQSGK
ncbi:hypothetical protein [Propionivibrio sp.]|uniref:hypothetical protein n=1 Tax=Propionivibrio sp. TaxID=2212460 RepID=UPI003BEFEFED